MREQKCLGLLLIVMTMTAGATCPGQTLIQARAEASYKRGKMIGVTKMSNPIEVSGCSTAVVTGKVASVKYNDRHEIATFVLETRNAQTKTLQLAKSLYDDLPPEAEVALPRLLSNGKRIRVVAYQCGSGLEADQIKALDN